MEEAKWQAFLTELTALCHEHGIGIEGGRPYELEAEDSERKFSLTDEGDLEFA